MLVLVVVVVAVAIAHRATCTPRGHPYFFACENSTRNVPYTSVLTMMNDELHLSLGRHDPSYAARIARFVHAIQEPNKTTGFVSTPRATRRNKGGASNVDANDD